MGRIALGVAFTALLAAGSAHAAVSVVGDGIGAVCARAAVAGDASDQSMDACNQAVIQATPDDKAGTYVNRGVLLLHRKQVLAARTDFEEAERLNPAMGEAVVNRAATLLAERRYLEALVEIDRGLALAPEEPQKALFNRGIANEGLDDNDAAYIDYANALQLAPDWEAPRLAMERLAQQAAKRRH